MEFQTLKRSHLKRNIIIGVVVVAIISAVVLNFTRARYRTTQSIPIVNGTINYTLPDLNITALYIDGVEAEELDSNTEYTLDTTQSTCTYKDGSTIPNLTLSYDNETQTFTITPYTTKGTKCTLYFEEKELAGETMLANYPTQLTRTDFSTTVTNTTTGTIYYADTSKGRTYYFAGNPTDNWVHFAGFYWRIIRINEDGTIRMIYSGDGSPQTTGSGTQIGTSDFNSNDNDNAYVGYMYESYQVHGLTSESAIKKVLDDWYYDNLRNYASDIDGNAGFCGDREPSTSSDSSNGSGGRHNIETYYGAYIRLVHHQNPTFECQNNSDLYTTIESSVGNKVLEYPIGLISADEVVYAGGVEGINNTSYYLYTAGYYWTMSPHDYDSGARTFLVGYYGYLNFDIVFKEYGVRPVINLDASVSLSGSGTTSNPYEVVM